MTRIGLIARADNSGLGIQSWEFARAMQPAKTLVIDVGFLQNTTSHCNKATYLDRYPDADVFTGWQPDTGTLLSFMHTLDVIFAAETFYSPEVISLARKLDVRTVVAPNFEFLDLQTECRPDLFAAPTLWRFDEIPGVKTHLPVPIPLDRFTERETDGRRHFLHVIGRPAVNDRNGTDDLLQAVQYVTADIKVTVRCQDAPHAANLISRYSIPANVDFTIDGGDVTNYWDLYQGDVMVMPRRYGGLCLPAQEAVGAGMPVIMPDISPNNTWLPERWLVPAHCTGSFMAKNRIDIHAVNPEMLAAKIDRFATDDQFYRQAAADASRIRGELSWDTLKPIYEKVLADA